MYEVSRANRRLKWTAAAAAVGIAAGAGLWFTVGGGAGDGPEALVTRYLEAVRAGDVVGALDLTGWAPDADSGAFLTASALDTDWTVDEVTEVETGDDVARVEVTLSSPGVGQADGVFDLVATAGSWRLDMPYVEVGFGDVGLDYFDVNGQRHVPSKYPAHQRYLLFPGLYHFYAAENPAVDVTTETRLLLPGSDVTRVDAEVSVTEAGAEGAQEAVNDYIDECATASTAYVEGCPFSAQGTALDALLNIEYMNDVRNAEWTVEEYPIIETVYSDGRFEVTDVEPGEVELSATGTERIWDDAEREFYDGDDIDFTVPCRIEAEWLELGVGYDGAWTVRHFTDFDDEYDWRPGSVAETCGSASAW